jgi:hypothetical protein
MQKRLNWRALTKNLCPRCLRKLDFDSDKDMLLCTISCGFMISHEKVNEITANFLLRRKRTFGSPDNSYELNNFGRRPFFPNDDD